MKKISIIKYLPARYYPDIEFGSERLNLVVDRTEFIEVTDEDYQILLDYYHGNTINGKSYFIFELESTPIDELVQNAKIELEKEKEKRAKNAERQAKIKETMRLNKEKKEKEQLDKLLKKYSKKEPQVLSEVAITHKKLLGEK